MYFQIPICGIAIIAVIVGLVYLLIKLAKRISTRRKARKAKREAIRMQDLERARVKGWISEEEGMRK